MTSRDANTAELDAAPAAKRATTAHSDRLVLGLTNEDAEVQMIEVKYSDMPDDLAAAMRARIADDSSSNLIEGKKYDLAARWLMIAIGQLEPADPAHLDTHDSFDWSDGAYFPKFTKAYNTVACHVYAGWKNPVPKQRGPTSFANCDFLWLSAFF